MIELGVARNHLLRKVLPFALSSTLGVLAVGAWPHLSTPKNDLKLQAESTPVSHSRTWLIVKSRPTSVQPFTSHSAGSLELIKFRARFGENGKVSQVVLLSDSPRSGEVYDLINNALHIRFIPPTEDGRPLAATVSLAYEVNAVCACGNDLLDDGICQGGYIYYPVNLTVGIMSVEGSTEPEGWRVVYE